VAQARAERRFADVRKLANALLFDYHDAIRDLRGARPVRERMVRDALGYLDGLARESGEDPSLQRELAGAYKRIGDLQGGDNSSLGDPEGAALSYGKAVGIFESLLRGDSGNAGLRREAAQSVMAFGRLVWGRGDLSGGLAHARRARALLDPLVASAPADTDLRLQLSAANNLLGQISLEEGKTAQALEYHRADVEQFEAAPESERRRPAVRHAISVTYGYLADAQSESGDLVGALASHRRSRALRRELAAEFPDNATYAEAASTARYYEATVLSRLGRWEESLALHRESWAEDSTGSFNLCRVGEALGALGRHEEALGYLRSALGKHERELRADTASLFSRLAVVEDLGRICKSTARLGRPEASAACVRATAFAEAIAVEPTHAFPRAFLAAVWTEIAEAHDTLAGRPATGASDRRIHRVAAGEQHRRSHEIWSDLMARGLVSPVDTARVSAAADAIARAERRAIAADR
jgi:tetratricopeptide (TPR) repeat protein